MNYTDFLAGKRHANDQHGFKPLWLPDFLYPFQTHLTDWSIRKGRSALLEDCGLGKTPQLLVWSENIVRKTNKNVLVLTPLAVSPQTVKEGKKFGIEVHHARDGKVRKGINAVNYERLHQFNSATFSGVVCDESSILKNVDGKLRRRITKFLHAIPYRLLTTATPAPNDYMELGTSSEALGQMSRGQMLGMFFSHNDKESESTQQWFLKGHAKRRFWEWVCTWARALRKPADLGFDDKGFDLPELITKQHTIVSAPPPGYLRQPQLKTLNDQRGERKATLLQRCEKVADLVNGKDYCVVWCHLIDEGNLLEKLIPNAIQVQGKDRDEVKEERLTAFSNGKIKTLITKPKIGGFGLNWQHCNHMTFFPSHSYEQWYQAVRRCWRFGQKRQVTVDIVTSSGESRVLSNMIRKERAASEMYDSLVRAMGEFQVGKHRSNGFKERVEVPAWLQR